MKAVAYDSPKWWSPSTGLHGIAASKDHSLKIRWNNEVNNMY
jgi:hypothetical protein